MSEQKTKEEVLKGMKHHQEEYAKLSAEYKVFKEVEEKAQRTAIQMKRLEEYKAKYNFFVDSDATAKPINWEEVEMLIKSTLDSSDPYVLGSDFTGMQGLISPAHGSNTQKLTPMVEEESDVKKYVEREMRRLEWEARYKKK